jgi:phosphomannomutase
MKTVHEFHSELLAWIEQDPDQETAAELRALLEKSQAGDAAASAEITERFSTRLSFGTAGLRGAIAAGPNRMNRVVVIQAAAGLARYLLSHAPAEKTPSVVIGYDGRKNSEVFARDTAEVMSGLGIEAFLMPRMLPTPVLAFSVRELDASAGVMVTASHNPAADNGYKVYLGGENHGSQIVSPDDARIAEQIDIVASEMNAAELSRGPFSLVAESVIHSYISQTALVAGTPQISSSAQPQFVYTAMHGVGYETFAEVISLAGFDAPVVVAEQNTPDALFPTVAFPNPEEPGALDLAYALARANNSELIVANDPDADRLAIAIPDASNPEGYRRLTGNELGALLGWRTAQRLASHHKSGTLACSIVSSPALSAVAEHYGLKFQWTLTGFKWVSRVENLAFGYEEALGYLVNPETIRDKDGISAAVALLSIVSELKTQGKTLIDHLDEFSMTFGHFASDQISLRVTELSEIPRLMSSLRSDQPSDVGGISVATVDDLLEGNSEFPPSDVLRFWLEDGSRIMVRPSGTEPKLKVYIDVVAKEGQLGERRIDAETRLSILAAGMKELLGL